VRLLELDVCTVAQHAACCLLVLLRMALLRHGPEHKLPRYLAQPERHALGYAPHRNAWRNVGLHLAERATPSTVEQHLGCSVDVADLR